MIEITFKNLKIVDLPLAPVRLGYHANKMLPFLKRLNATGKHWKGDSLSALAKDLCFEGLYTYKPDSEPGLHGLRLGLRDLMDCGAIELKPDPRFEPLL